MIVQSPTFIISHLDLTVKKTNAFLLIYFIEIKKIAKFLPFLRKNLTICCRLFSLKKLFLFDSLRINFLSGINPKPNLAPSLYKIL